MKPTYALYLAILMSTLGLGCVQGTAAQSSGTVLETVPTNASSRAPTASDWRSVVEPLATHPDVLTKDWSGFRRILPLGCFKDAGDRAVKCPLLDGIVRISIDPGPQGIVDVVLNAPADCAQIYALLSKHFGRGSVENGDLCMVEWKLGHWVKHASANLTRGRKDPSQIHLQFAVEQGP
jgi:hypothetical protein